MSPQQMTGTGDMTEKSVRFISGSNIATKKREKPELVSLLLKCCFGVFVSNYPLCLNIFC